MTEKGAGKYIVLSNVDGGPRRKEKEKNHGETSLHKLVMAVVKKSTTTIQHG
jgi:hypothetical protein